MSKKPGSKGFLLGRGLTKELSKGLSYYKVGPYYSEKTAL